MPAPAILGLIPGLLSAGVGVINSINSRNQSIRNTEATIRANKELAEYEWDRNLEMWHRMNEYNTPMQQMQRFKDAGLNPNLIYGQGTPGNATTLPKYSRPTLDYSGRLPFQLPLAEFIQQYQDVSLKNAQIENVTQATKNAKLDADLKGLDKLLKEGTLDPKIRQEAQKAINEMVKTRLGNSRLEIQRLTQEEKKRGITKKELDIIYQQHKNEWMKMGITNSDSVIFRFLIRMFMESGLSLDGLKKGMKSIRPDMY